MTHHVRSGTGALTVHRSVCVYTPGNVMPSRVNVCVNQDILVHFAKKVSPQGILDIYFVCIFTELGANTTIYYYNGVL